MIAAFSDRIFLDRRVRPYLVAAFLTLSLATGANAQAQTAPPTNNAQPPFPQAQMAMPPNGNSSNWNNERFERQEFREEMEKIRKEHEELEAARDKLLDQCVNATGAQADECEKQKQALHEWHDRLHDRMRVLHDKMEAERKEHPQGMDQGMSMGGNDGMMNNGRAWPHANNAPAGAPAGSTAASGLAPSAPPQ